MSEGEGGIIILIPGRCPGKVSKESKREGGRLGCVVVDKFEIICHRVGGRISWPRRTARWCPVRGLLEIPSRSRVHSAVRWRRRCSAAKLPPPAAGRGRGWASAVDVGQSHLGSILLRVVEVLAIVPESSRMGLAANSDPARPGSPAAWVGVNMLVSGMRWARGGASRPMDWLGRYSPRRSETT